MPATKRSLARIWRCVAPETPPHWAGVLQQTRPPCCSPFDCPKCRFRLRRWDLILKGVLWSGSTACRSPAPMAFVQDRKLQSQPTCRLALPTRPCRWASLSSPLRDPNMDDPSGWKTGSWPRSTLRQKGLRTSGCPRRLNVQRKVGLAQTHEEFHGHCWTSFFKRPTPQTNSAKGPRCLPSQSSLRSIACDCRTPLRG